MLKIKVESAEQTQAIAKEMGPLLQARDILLLDGDLGAGKTTFTKGLAEGLGIHRNIKSPTFTIIREYQQGRLPLYHMDVYRLEETGGNDLGLEMTLALKNTLKAMGFQLLNGHNLSVMKFRLIN